MADGDTEETPEDRRARWRSVAVSANPLSADGRVTRDDGVTVWREHLQNEDTGEPVGWHDKRLDIDSIDTVITPSIKPSSGKAHDPEVVQ